MNRKNKILLSVLFALIAALFFAIMNALIKICRTELSSEIILFYRFAIGLVLSFPSFFAFKNFSFKLNHYWLHFMRAITAFLAILCLVYAIKYIPLVNVVLLGITYPLFIPLLVFFFFRKRLSMKMILGIVLGFIGVVFVIQPDATSLIDNYSLIALLGGFLIALSMLCVRLLHRHATAEQISFSYLLQAALFGLILGLFHWEWPSRQLWPIVIAMSIAGTLYQYALIYALKFAHASLVSPIMYASILFSVLIELIFWKHIPNTAVWFGFGLIFLGTCITVWIQGQAEHLTRK